MFSESTRIVVTGANGFIGSALVSALRSKYPVLAVSRVLPGLSSHEALLSDFLSASSSDKIRKFAPTHLVHCAAAAHKKYPNTNLEYDRLRRANIQLPVDLASVSLRLGLKRFVFLSSVGVHGSYTPPGVLLNESSQFFPVNPYSASKLAAELEIRRLLKDTACEFSIIRPALVYGRGMPGNLRALVKAIDLGLPFPLASIKNRRSFISIENLVSAIEAVTLHPSAPDEAYLAADEEWISSANLIRCAARARNRPALLLPLSPGLMRSLAQLPLVGRTVGQLVDDLVVDSTKLRQQLGWRQPSPQAIALQEAFARGL